MFGCIAAIVCRPDFASADVDPYVRDRVANARFGTGKREELLRKSYSIASAINSTIFGQEVAASVMQDRVIQYLENFPNRQGEPPHVNFIGLTGVGKSAIVDKLRELGFPVLQVDAQRYAVPGRDLIGEYGYFLEEQARLHKPLIIVVEELDKLAEIRPNKEGVTTEVTWPTIAAMNEALSNGRVTVGRTQPLDLSNFLFVTNMNFAPSEVEAFSLEVLGAEKSFYDFTVEDFDRFDQWVQNDRSARYKVLSRLFRSNTVGRFAPNTVIMQSLKWQNYENIVRKVVADAVVLNAAGANSGKRVQVDVDESMIAFLLRETTYAPSGARETVKRAGALMEQLINFGIKADEPNSESLNRPRRLRISALTDGAGQTRAAIEVTPLVLRAPAGQGRKLFDGVTFTAEATFNRVSRLFLPPAAIASIKPAATSQRKPIGLTPVTNKAVMAARFPRAISTLDGMTAHISSKLIDQENLAALMEDDFRRYMGRPGPAIKEPSYRILAGLPGNGKSDVVAIAAGFAHLPVVRLNMQNYTSDSADSVAAFLQELSSKTSQARAASPTGRFVLLIEELDKIHEILPDGKLVARPVMAAVKDLLNDGLAEITSPVSSQRVTADIRTALTYVTMNFSVDRFNFHADPRLTTAEDVRRASNSIKKRPADLKGVLGAMFLPETVSRMLAKTTIVDPPTQAGHERIADLQIPNVGRERLIDADGRNVARVQVEVAPSYRSYLYSESVIPSEGARLTVINSKTLFASDLEAALKNLPRGRKYATQPLTLTFTYQPERRTVTVQARLASDTKDKDVEVLKKVAELRFPPIEIEGQVPINRMRVSAHEFGHARMGQMLGLRFETVVVAAPTNAMGGYVKFWSGNRAAKDMVADIYSLLASRAFERIVLSASPRAAESVLDITPGASRDIQMATESLFAMLNKLGFNPYGGTMDRIGFPYANFSSLPHDVVEKLGAVLRDLEAHMVDDLLNAQPQSWYVDKITQLARKGAMSEAEFYALVGAPYPGEDKNPFGSDSLLRKYFGPAVEAELPASIQARSAPIDQNGRTVAAALDLYVKVFVESLQRHFKSPGAHMSCEGFFRAR